MVMPRARLLVTLLAFVLPSSALAADSVLFEDNFDDGLSDRWQLIGLSKEDYRIKDGGLELRVQRGKYTYTYRPATDKAGPLRIIVNQDYAHFQVGPSVDGEYLNFFFSAIRQNSKERGFCLAAAGAPSDAEHWVRFDDFRVIKTQ